MAVQTILPGAGFARELSAANADVWEAMQQHRFVNDVIADRLDPGVFRRYLVFEHAFVETAVLIFGHAMLKAPGFAQKRRLIGVLHSLAEEQLPYFVEVFAALGIAARPPELAMPPAVRRFERRMLAIAEEGSFGEILTIMLAAEWMYGTWCLRAARSPSREPELRRWIELHTEPDFLDQVEWLMRELDFAAAGLDVAGRDKLSTLFGEALRLEIAFHSAAYTEWPTPRTQADPSRP